MNGIILGSIGTAASVYEIVSRDIYVFLKEASPSRDHQADSRS